MDAAKYISVWKKNGNEVGPQVWKTAGVISVPQFKSVLTETMKMTLVEGVDNSATNLYAAAIFHTATKNAAGHCWLQFSINHSLFPVA